MPTSTSERGLEARLAGRARALGFDDVAIAPAAGDDAAAARLGEFVAAGRHGTMAWLADTLARRRRPTAMWPAARSAVVVAMSYGQDLDPLARLAARDRGVISLYALNRDYHDVLKGRLKTLAQWLARQAACDVKVFVDTAPLMEKPLAQAAGLGWQGRHTNLVSRRLGSWFFLGAILTDAELAPGPQEADHCGSCRACLDVCPTGAFPAPYQLDARRCISYLTIEHAGPIAPEFRAAIGNRIYGCDDCLAVCPWNKFAGRAAEAKLAARADLVDPPLATLARLDDAGFRALFSGSPVKRTGRDRFVRNVMIAIGNSGDASLLEVVRERLADASPLVRGMAVWALSRLAGPGEVARLAAAAREPDPDVRREWEAAA